MGNMATARKTLDRLVALGVQEFIVCAGARNAPLVSLLNSQKTYNVYPFFEERSAAFFALGRIKNHQKPVAVVTTSGTAAAELLPATIEAFYSGLPLVLLTADRPRGFRGSASPQTIEQVDIFKNYVDGCWDIESAKDLHDREWKAKNPLHVNICFHEPLLDDEDGWVPGHSAEVAAPKDPSSIEALMPQLMSLSKSVKNLTTAFSVNKHNLEIAQAAFNQCQKPLVIVSGLPEKYREMVQNFCMQLGAPVYIEALSGLRESQDLKQLQVLRPHLKSYDLVVRIGSMPTIRLWRDLEATPVPVLNFSHLPFSGLSWQKEAAFDLNLLNYIEVPPHLFPQRWPAGEDFDKIENLLTKYPNSEPAMFRKLSDSFEDKSSVYLGNSLPIREWDLTSTHHKKWARLEANRGANGIDGQLSTFFGFAKGNSQNYALIGDLTALYDMTSAWATRFLESGTKAHIVVINNGGGRIFRNIFHDPAFENTHEISLKPFADMWGLLYQRVKSSEQIDKSLWKAPLTLTEVFPNLAQSDGFWNDWKE